MRAQALTLLSGHAGAALLLLLRNLVVAHLIPVADYGIAITFALTMALVEMSTQFGLQQQIIQHKDGDAPRFQSALQGFQLVRGVLAGLLLFAMAGPMAGALQIPQAAWAYQVMAVLPLLRALQHFDIHRLNRQMRFGPMLLTGVIPAAVSLLAVFPLALWLGDYRVMLLALFLQEGLATATSHAFAQRPYRLSLDRQIIAGSLSFGWPLLLNGALLFLVMQGDKLIVGTMLGMTDLAIFGMGVTLTLTPALILSRSAQGLFLPQLARVADDPAEWGKRCSTMMRSVLVMGLAFPLLLTLIGPPLVWLALPPGFAALAPLLPWLGLALSFRLLKTGPTIMAIAAGQTRKLLWANVPRVILLAPAAWIASATGGTGSLVAITQIAAIGEAAGLAITLALIAADWRVMIRDLRGPLYAFLASLCVTILQAGSLVPGPDWVGPCLCIVTLAFGLACLAPRRIPNRVDRGAGGATIISSVAIREGFTQP